MSIFRISAMLALAMSLAACLDGAGLCQNEIVSRVDAPGGDRTAVLFQRACGATTGFTTQISILGPGEVPTGKGNVFIADDDHGAAAIGDWGGPWANMEWLGPDRLRIRHAPGSRVFLQRETMAGVRVIY